MAEELGGRSVIVNIRNSVCAGGRVEEEGRQERRKGEREREREEGGEREGGGREEREKINILIYKITFTDPHSNSIYPLSSFKFNQHIDSMCHHREHINLIRNS